MAQRSILVLLVLSLSLAVLAQGEFKKKSGFWSMFGFQGDESSAGEEHHEEESVNPFKRFFGPLAGEKTNPHFKKLVDTFSKAHGGHVTVGPDTTIYGHCYMHPEKNYTGDTVTGLILLRQEDKYAPVHMKIELHGITTEHHDHGLHIHEFGDMSDGCHYVGEYYNPFHDVQRPGRKHRRVGDLGDLHEDENGDIGLEADLDLVSLSGPYSILGRSMVVSQKAGHSGAAMACCTIATDDGHDWHKDEH